MCCCAIFLTVVAAMLKSVGGINYSTAGLWTWDNKTEASAGRSTQMQSATLTLRHVTYGRFVQTTGDSAPGAGHRKEESRMGEGGSHECSYIVTLCRLCLQCTDVVIVIPLALCRQSRCTGEVQEEAGWGLGGLCHGCVFRTGR